MSITKSMGKKLTYKELYGQQLSVNLAKSPYINFFWHNPYSFLKARYYMGLASAIVYFLQSSGVTPNQITKLYILWGVLAGFMIAIGTPSTLGVGIFMVFSKGVLDWTDGHIARLQNKTSLTGHILDLYGARVNSLIFVTSLGFYQYTLHGEEVLFLILAVVYPLAFSLQLHRFGYKYLYEHLANKGLTNEENEDYNQQELIARKSRYANFLINFLDDRSRTTDFVCLLIVLEQMTVYKFSWVYFVLMQLKWAVVCCGVFYVFSKEDCFDKMVGKAKVKSNSGH
jgi:hypothetical protein